MARFDIVPNDRNIETDMLVVEDNIIRWSNTIIQISNIALISTVKARSIPFPFLALLPVAYGIYAITEYEMYGWWFIIGAALWIIYWFGRNEAEKKKTILRISLNSGVNFNILFYDKKFLREVMRQLANLISKPFSSRSLTINVRDSNFGGNSSVVNTLNS